MFVVVVVVAVGVVVGVVVGPGGWWHQGGRGRNNLPDHHAQTSSGVRIRYSFYD